MADDYMGTGKSQSYWQSQADLVKSGNLSRETTTLATQHQLNMLGRSAYMDLYPEIFHTFGPTGTMMSDREIALMKMQALGNMLNQYYGPESTWIRWLIRQKIGEIGESAKVIRYAEEPIPEIPEWAQEYLIPRTMEIPSSRERRRTAPATREVYDVRPLGAQAELNPEQQAWLAGYMAYGKAGYPTKYSEEAIRGLADIDRWWSPHKIESQAMFPQTQKLSPRWATAYQR